MSLSVQPGALRAYFFPTPQEALAHRQAALAHQKAELRRRLAAQPAYAKSHYFQQISLDDIQLLLHPVCDIQLNELKDIVNLGPLPLVEYVLRYLTNPFTPWTLSFMQVVLTCLNDRLKRDPAFLDPILVNSFWDCLIPQNIRSRVLQKLGEQIGKPPSPAAYWLRM
jgi:hypothetical protein